MLPPARRAGSTGACNVKPARASQPPNHQHHSHHPASNAADSKGRHEGHSVTMFRDRFWITLLLSLPTLVWSEMIQHTAGFPGVLGAPFNITSGVTTVQGTRIRRVRRQPSIRSPPSACRRSAGRP